VFVPQAVESFAYDADGNLISDGRWNYTWDAENRLIAAECRWSPYYVAGPIPQIKVTFKYDAFWRRIEKKVWENTAVQNNPGFGLRCRMEAGLRVMFWLFGVLVGQFLAGSAACCPKRG
jgi:YD repeat-containing protein